MNFLTRFLKIFLFELVLSALCGFVFYLLVIKDASPRDAASYEELISTVKLAIGLWLGFITFISFVLAAVGAKRTVSVPVYDRDSFLYKLDSAVRERRYRPQTQTESLLVYKPPMGQFLAEKVTVELQPGGALITAPRPLLRKIQERL